MSKRLSFILLSSGLSLVMLLIFFSYVIKDPDQIWFSTSGDGMKTYFNALFHVRYDTDNALSGGMNYPFGEVYTFTDSQFPVVSAIRFISENIVDIREHTVAIINLLMLFSLLAGAVFLGLILTESGVSWWYSALVSVGIAFLSPQINRLGGHFSLAWVVWIPMMIWLIMKFDKKRTWYLTFLIGFITWLAGLMHFYYLGFFGFIIGGYWFYRFVRYFSTKTYWYRDLLHFFVQYILPVLLIQLFVLMNDSVTDRPGYPFGFQTSYAHPVGVFFPSGTPYAFVPQILTVFSHISWESYSYIGTVALLGVITGMVLAFIRKFTGKTIIPPANNPVLRVMFWISLASLLFSFGIPFIFGLKDYTEQYGLIRQIRVLARFSWLFYYVVNIVVFTAVYRFSRFDEKPGWRMIPAFAALALLLTEAVYHTRGIAPQLNNTMTKMQTGRIFQGTGFNIHPQDYQGVIPLPYFHIGSENLWMEGTDNSKRKALLLSLQTGIPTTGAILSRTSLSQSFMLDAMLKEPLQRMEIVDYLSDERPFLVLKMKGYTPSDSEKRLLQEASPVNENGDAFFFSLPVNLLKSIHEIRRREMVQQFDSLKLFRVNNYFVNDTLFHFRMHDFDESNSRLSLRGKGTFLFRSRQWTRLSRDTLTGLERGKLLIISFWIYNYFEDGNVRGQLRVNHRSPADKQGQHIETSEFFRHIKAYQGDWVLIEAETETVYPDEVLELSVMNDIVPEKVFVLDELLIREKGLDLWYAGQNYLLLNGRKYLKR